MTLKIIQQGAEAKILQVKNKVIKDRIPKSYRLQELDNKIRKRRTKSEAKILEKASKLIPIPKISSSELSDFQITMDFIDGKKLSDHLDELPNSIEICETIGSQIATLHDNEIIHGDLTTSNMILEKDKLYFIDFGLSFISNKAEDKAVDLHLIKQALEAKHFKHYEEFFKAVIEGYKSSENSKTIIERLKKVEARGRYKQSY
ncbi:Kae1-associated kinase Bud32 [Candidatus Pacearchaeota archaeon]|nr:Kae1-associated kinase Bud32 [Candidatus Pacearchaeota archaeon]